MYKIFRIYIVYALALFLAAIYKFSSMKPVPKKRKQREKITQQARLRSQPLGQLGSVQQPSHTHTHYTHVWKSVCACVYFVLFCWQIAHVRDAIQLLTYSSRPGSNYGWAPNGGRTSGGIWLAVLQLNLKFLRNPTKHGAKYGRTQYEKVLWGKLRINVFNNSRNGRRNASSNSVVNKSQLLFATRYFRICQPFQNWAAVIANLMLNTQTDVQVRVECASNEWNDWEIS